MVLNVASGHTWLQVCVAVHQALLDPGALHSHPVLPSCNLLMRSEAAPNGVANIYYIQSHHPL